MSPFNRALFSSASGDWETPQELFDELDREFHFTLDAAATPANAKCRDFFTTGQNALHHAWPGRVFCNPPYGRELWKWVFQGYTEALCCLRNEVVVMLLPSRTDTQWWHDYVMKADEIRFIKGRLKFSGHKNPAPFPSCIVVFGGRDG